MKLQEWHRTILLLLAIVFATAFIVWLRTGYQSGLLDILGYIYLQPEI